MSEEKYREIQKNDHDRIFAKMKLYFVHNPGRWIHADILFTFAKFITDRTLATHVNGVSRFRFEAWLS